MANKKIGVWMVGTKRVLAAIQHRSIAGRKIARVEVGFSAHHAVYVHENLLVNHPTGQAKYLSLPARIYQSSIAAIVAHNLKNKESLETAVFRGGKFLLDMSRPLVPVDTGELKASGFVKVV